MQSIFLIIALQDTFTGCRLEQTVKNERVSVRLYYIPDTKWDLEILALVMDGVVELSIPCLTFK